MLKTRRGQLITFGAGVLIFAGVLAWDFRNHDEDPQGPVAPRWNTVDTEPVPSVEWVEPQDDGGDSKSVIKKVYDGYQKLRPAVPFFEEEPAPAVEPEVIVSNEGVVTEVLIKYEYVPKEKGVVKLEPLELPIGTMIYARMLKPLDSRLPKEEQPVYAELVRPLVIDAQTLLPSRTRLLGDLKSMRQGRATFSDEWRVLIDGKYRYSLKAKLQERDYDAVNGTYGAFDGVSGLRMQPVDITYEPEVHGAERLFDEIVRPLVVDRSQEEILRQLELPSLQDPWSFGGVEENTNEGPGSFFLQSGTEFYLQKL